jgi:hypothetical protein
MHDLGGELNPRGFCRIGGVLAKIGCNSVVFCGEVVVECVVKMVKKRHLTGNEKYATFSVLFFVSGFR